MAVEATPFRINKDSQQSVVRYLQSAQSMYLTSYNIRNQMRRQDLAYYREEDLTPEQLRAKFANQTGDAKKIQNHTVPVVKPVVESALGYLTGVFLTGTPIFGAVAPPGQEAALQQFDAVNEDNAIKFGWVPDLMKTLRKGLKHDVGAVEVTWERKKIYNIESPQLTDISRGTKVEELYQGNQIKDLDVYNLLLDPRVSPDKNHLDGEFAGYTEMVSRIALKKFTEELDSRFTMNFTEAFESGSGALTTSAADASFYIPEINPEALIPANQTTSHNWMQWAGLEGRKNQKINYHESYEKTVLYARILPIDFGMTVPNRTNVQIWKFIIINRQVVIYAERQTNAHNYLPIIVAKPTNDGLGWQSKSFAQDVIPAQQISSALMNSGLAAQRRKVYDRLLYDPTRVRKEDIDRIDPVARIPVKNGQFQKGFEGAVQPIPFNDQGVPEILQMSQQIVQDAEMTSGQNRVQKGQFQKGNKTRREFETVMSNANARQQMMALALEYTFFQPIKEIIKANILQFQPPTTIVLQKPMQTSGGAVPDQQQQAVKVDPTELRKAMIAFKLSDGLLSTELLASLDVAGTMIQAATAVPQIQMEYDVMGILEHTWSLQGLHWISSYKRSPEQKQQYVQDVTANATAQGNMPPGPPTTPDAGAAGATR